MYEIWADDLLVYSDISPLESVKVIEPKLSLADSAAGSLEMTLPPTNVGYSVIQRMTTNIIVTCDEEEIWRGRVLTDDYDFWNRRKVFVEGELAYLNDTIQPPCQYLSESTTIETFITSLLTNHNANVEDNKKFEVGMITVQDGDQLEDDDHIYRYTNYETTLECLNEKLVERLGGHLRVRHQNGKRYLDYISDDSIGANNQAIQFGLNLMDFVKSFDMSELATVLVPRGARLEEEEIEGLEAYLTIKECATVTDEHEQGTLFIRNQNAVDTYGWIEAVIDWDNVTDKDILYSKAKKYLEDEQYEKMVLEIKAVDLKYAMQSEERIKMLDKLRCISEPHGMDHTFPVTQMQIRLDKPDDSIYTLGTDVVLSLTQSTNKTNEEVMAKIDAIPSKHAILKAAEENAYQIITGTRHDGSYVHFDVDDDGHIIDIAITDGIDDDHSLNKWIWNEGGLGHMQRPNYQTPWGDITDVNVAITHDGQIVANMITTGVLRAYNNAQAEDPLDPVVYSLDTDSGFISMLYGRIAGFSFDKDKLTASNSNYSALVSPTAIGCGRAGYGVVNIVGNTSSSEKGYIQLSNSGDPNTCKDGFRIYGSGRIVKYDASGNVEWDKYLSQIPDYWSDSTHPVNNHQS